MAERAPRSPSHFRQRDVTAAIRAAEAAGKEVVRVEIEPGGKVVIITSRDDPLTGGRVDLGEEIKGWQP